MNRLNYYIAICFILISCRSSKPEYDVVIPVESIPPGQCRVIGTVVKIDSILDTTDPSSLCSKSPCNAIIRIDSVIGYGSAFLTPLTAGNTMSVKLMFTLAPITLELSEGKSESYPGLPEGSQFIADIRSQTLMKTGEANTTSYLVYGYKRYLQKIILD